MSNINLFTLEVRFEPDSRVVDNRGLWVHDLQHALDLPRWQLVDNRVDVYNPETGEQAFLSFRNMGLVMRNVSAPEKFSEKASKLVSAVLGNHRFSRDPLIHRFGLRSQFCVPYDGEFIELRERYAASVAPVPASLLDALGGNLVDLGCPLHFQDGDLRYNTMSGPMEDAQIKQLFEWVEEPPKVALYFDIDSILRPGSTWPSIELQRKATTLAKKNTERFEELRRAVLSTYVEPTTASI